MKAFVLPEASQARSYWIAYDLAMRASQAIQQNRAWPEESSYVWSGLICYTFPMITYDDFKKVEIKAGKILSAEKIPNTDKLVKLSVDFGEMAETADVAGNKSMLKPAPRQIVSGISGFFS